MSGVNYQRHAGSASWSPPPSPFSKINVDASWSKGTQRGFAGVVIRADDGRFLVAARYPIQAPCALVAEAVEMLKGCELGISLGFNLIILESNSLATISALRGSIENGSWEAFPVLARVRWLSGAFQDCRWSWIPRSANMTADALASADFTEMCDIVWERKRWGGCWGAFSCFPSQKGGKRIVPATRISEGNASANQPNGPQTVGLANQTTSLAPSLLAPPSSPASFTNSALPSTAQSPSCFLSANSPGGPSSTMYATGPYANETQLVSPPVFSTFTTEPSTAPLTPPPELAHLTTPSSPDVPYARFLSSSVDLKSTEKTNYIAANDLHSTYSLYPGSPASSLRSPISRASNNCSSSSFPERDFPSHWDPSASPQNGTYPRSGSARMFGHDPVGASVASQDSNFFCPATFAQFYLDNPPFPHAGGRLSVSKDSDVYTTGGNGSQSRHSRSPKQDVEEIEAYRASFGFSADEIITTTQYVEISDVMEDSFTMTPFPSHKLPTEESMEPTSVNEGLKAHKTKTNLQSQDSLKSEPDLDDGGHCDLAIWCTGSEDLKSWRQSSDVSRSSTRGIRIVADEEDIFSKMGSSKLSRKYQMGQSSSDAEIDYRRGRSLRERKLEFAWND